MNLVPIRAEANVRAYAGQWIIDCPVCNGAQVVRLGDRCVDCGQPLEVRWPPEETRLGVERLLSLRPIPYTRNWFPGETLHDLLAENILHGVGPTREGQEMMIVGDRIELDSLPKPQRRLQIGA